MTLAIEKLKELFNKKILHICCFCHICNLSIGLISTCGLCRYFIKLMNTWGKFMRKTSGSQILFSKFLAERGFKETQMPRFVKNRWKSFWDACYYLKEFVQMHNCSFSCGKLYNVVKKLLITEFSKELILQCLYERPFRV